MKRRSIILLMVMLWLATVVFAFVACNDTDKELVVTDGLQYTLSNNGMYYSISGYSGTESDVIIGKTYNSKPVQEISSSAFKNNTEITSIKIPDSVTSIGEVAFWNCSSLTSITIPDSVTSIGEGVFADCSSLTSVTIGNSVTSIGEGVFENCSSLTSVTIGNGVSSISDDAFFNCSSLTSINVGENNQSYKAIDGNLYTKDGVTLIQYAIGKTETSFVIPDGVTSIGKGAFESCGSLTSITIPDSVTSIGNYAFADCSSLRSINVGENNQSYKAIDGNLYTKDGVTLIQYAIGKTETSFVIPDSVTSIGSYAFAWCESLTSITIPDSVTSIGDDAFFGCVSLTSITIPDSVTSIGKWAFSGCSLTSVTFENTSGWWYASSSTATNGTSISSVDLANTSTAAEYLTSTYRFYYWKRS